MFDAFASGNLAQDERLLVEPVRRKDEGQRLPDHLRCGVSEQSLSRLVPGEHDPVQILANDGIVRGFNDGRQARIVRSTEWSWLRRPAA
jgi:hypothetical protein